MSVPMLDELTPEEFAREFDKRVLEAKAKGLWLYQYDPEFARRAVYVFSGAAEADKLRFPEAEPA